MSKELIEIVTKIVTEHPEVDAIYSNWKPNGIGGIIFVQIANIPCEEGLIIEDEYTRYIWETYEYMTSDMCSTVIVSDTVEEMESLYELIYSKEVGGFVNAL